MAQLSQISVILASASKSRAALLREAGLLVEIMPANIDEASLRDGMQAESAPPYEIAVALAELKALRVSRHHQGALVIGGDQILSCDERLFEKPGTRAKARAQLLALSGRTHELATAACVARDGDIIWHHVETSQLTMRPLSDAFIDLYLDAAGDSILGNVGSYALEGLGAQLFSSVRGDYFCVLGLPLLPLLGFLREHNVIPR